LIRRMIALTFLSLTAARSAAQTVSEPIDGSDISKER
jgi:hypothetical protein